jgi:hypothetical protein
MGHGTRQMCQTDKYGFPKAHRSGEKSFLGFQTGDIVKAIVPKGKNKGPHEGRVTIRQRPSFAVDGADGINPKTSDMRVIQRNDGYLYE